jgi:hypothetical protein
MEALLVRDPKALQVCPWVFGSHWFEPDFHSSNKMGGEQKELFAKERRHPLLIVL